LGGRRRPHESNTLNPSLGPSIPHNIDNNIPPVFVQFTDATVSRRHFEVSYLKKEKHFALRDLGSAGGTFVRIPPRKGVPLVPGTMIMLGKHQLLAMETTKASKPALPEVEDREEIKAFDVDVKTPRYGDVTTRETPRVGRFFSERLDEDEVFPCAGNGNAEEADDTNSETGPQRPQLQQDQLLEGEDKAETTMPNPCVEGMAECAVESCLLASELTPLQQAINTTNVASRSTNDKPHLSINTQVDELDDASTSSTPSSHPDPSDDQSLLVLRCFAPEGTPIQGREYPVTKQGATLGRKQGNSISFSHRVCDVLPPSAENSDAAAASPNVRYSFVGIDSSISGEHATIRYDNQSKVLELYDGVSQRCSTNGTWVRLSPMHKSSEWYPLLDQTEILIGTVRFEVSIDDVVVERDFFD